MRLELAGRPYVVFDPDNKEHRRYYYRFVETSSWGSCPVRFVVPEDHGDLIQMIQRSLVAHYVSKEFNRPKTTEKVAQKGKKTVDRRKN
jgi:hypothetical protein